MLGFEDAWHPHWVLKMQIYPRDFPPAATCNKPTRSSSTVVTSQPRVLDWWGRAQTQFKGESVSFAVILAWVDRRKLYLVLMTGKDRNSTSGNPDLGSNMTAFGWLWPSSPRKQCIVTFTTWRPRACMYTYAHRKWGKENAFGDWVGESTISCNLSSAASLWPIAHIHWQTVVKTITAPSSMHKVVSSQQFAWRYYWTPAALGARFTEFSFSYPRSRAHNVGRRHLHVETEVWSRSIWHPNYEPKRKTRQDLEVRQKKIPWVLTRNEEVKRFTSAVC